MNKAREVKGVRIKRHKIGERIAAGVVALILIIGNFLTYTTPIMADEGGSKLRLHYDMKVLAVGPGGTLIVPNLAGDAFDGIFREPQNGSHTANEDVGFLTFSGGSASAKASYVEIPKGPDGQDVLDGLHEVTISAIVNWTNDGENRWIFGFGTVLTPETNKYLFATPRHGIGGRNPIAAGISKQGWPNEALITGETNSMLAQGVWKHIVVTMSEEKDQLALYVDGNKVNEGSAKGIKLAEIIDPTAPFSGFLAKSIFTNDPYYKGSISDFRIYESAFKPGEIADLYREAASIIADLNKLTIEDAAASLDIAEYLHEDDTSQQAITRNLDLPAVGKHGVAIQWSSSRTDVLSNEGVVNRPDVDAEDVEVILQAELIYQGLTRTVQFHVKVLKQFDAAQTASLDAAGLRIYNTDRVKGNLRLPTIGKRGSQITWISNRPDVVKGSAEAEAAGDPYVLGRVTRPGEDTAVKLTARVEYGGAVVERVFDLMVLKAPDPLQYDAYFFAYFTGEYEGGEEISFAVAEHPLYWRSLNNGKSVLQSTMGEMGVRDPFIIRSPEGDKFYLLATDLKMGESTNFDQAQITGSHSIMIWESDDLVNWSEQRMVEVAPERGGNTWAPEAYYDEVTGEYVVFWASSMKVEDTYGKYPYGRPAGQYNVMYYATTRDFYEFSEPKVFIDDGFPTIDTTIIEHEGTLYRMTKSEVNYKVYLEKADNIYYDRDGIAANGFQFEPVAGTRSGNQGLIGHGGNNEGPTIFKDIHEDKWYLFLDSWPYHVRFTTNLEDGAQLVNNLLPESAYALPPGPRHGTVIPITRAEYEALVARYGVPGPVEQEEPVVHYTFDPEDMDGSTVYDVSGNGHHAELAGGATIDEADRIGDAGGAAVLDGSSEYVKLPDHLIQDLNLEKATFSIWVKLERPQSGARIFDFASDTGRAVSRNTMYLSPRGDSGALEFAIVTPFTEKFSSDTAPLPSNYKYALRGNQAVSVGAWQHVAVTIDGFEAALYLNGEKVASSPVYNVEPRMLLETTINYIGRSRSASHPYLAGSVDDFRIYNRALTDAEIAALAAGAESPDESPSGAELLLHYDMKDVSGATIRDQTGHFDGIWRNPDAAEWIVTNDAGVISFTGGSTASYIELPAGLLDGLSDLTVSALVNWSGNLPVEWLYALGRPNTETHYLYFTPRYNADSSARFGLATSGWRNEVSARSSTLPSKQWKLVTTVLDSTNETLRLYIDGILAGSSGTNGITLEQIRAMSGPSGYIARSFYSADPYFGGMIADFRIYDGALTATEVSALKAEADEKIAAMEGIFLQAASDKLTWESLAGSNESPDRVITDLVLPTSGAYGTTITWSSSDPGVISPTGAVNRPAYDEGDRTVILTATFRDGKNSLDKAFTVTVIKLPNDEHSVDSAIQALTVPNIDDVRGNLTLPTKGLYDTTITWTSSDPDVITPTGEVSRPEHGQGDVTVELTATVAKNAVSKRKVFQARVRELPVSEPYAGYFFAYFTGEGRADGEQIYFALSKGNDPLRWTELNEGKPLITSTLGERGVRDPFIIRSPEGDKFYMIATDLRIHGNGNWDRAQRYGSRSIMVWESTDLVDWGEQRMVEVAPPEAGNTWAPEVIYDETTGEYVVFWASKLYDNPEHTGNSHQRIMYAKTRDFHTFTEPQVYMDYGYSIIDTTMIKHNGKINRFTKDERDNNASSPYGKMVFQEVGDSLFDPDFRLIKEGVGEMKWVEGPTIFKSNTEDKWYLFVDEFGGRGYVPLETTDLDSGIWNISASYELPTSPRHGTVIPITQSEYDLLYAKYVAGHVPVTGVSLDRSEVTLRVGDMLQLKATVSPNYATNPQVVWSTSDDEVAVVTDTGLVEAVGAGSAVITVTTVEGGYEAKAVVTVVEHLVPKPPGDVRDVRIEPGDGKLLLSWQDPTEVGSGLQHIYVAAYEGDTVTASVYAAPGVGRAEISGLKNGVWYTVKLVVVDVDGLESEGIVLQGMPRRETSQPVIPPPASPPVTPPGQEKPAYEIGPDGEIIVRADMEEGSRLQVQLSWDALSKALSASPNRTLRIRAGRTVVTIDSAALGELGEDSVTEISVAEIEPSSLSAFLRTLLELQGANSAYLITVNIDGQPVADPQGSITVSIVWDEGAGVEGTQERLVYKMRLNGGLSPVVFSLYDERDGRMIFRPDDLGAYYLFVMASAEFDDVSGWSQEAVEALAVRGILLGKGDGLFDPQGTVTRAEFTAMIARLLSLEPAGEAIPFEDVTDDAWYAKELAAAHEAGIVLGKPDGTFGGDEPITRQEMAVLLYRAAVQLIRSQAGGEEGIFADASQIASYAQDAVSALAAAGIINGLPDGTFGPEQTATREQAAAMLWRLLQIVLGG